MISALDLTYNKPAQTKPIIAVDLDGTIAQYTQWAGEAVIGEPFPGAIEFLRRLSERYDIVIFSARASTPVGLSAIRRWIIANKLVSVIKEVTNEKKYSFVAYIDDRAITFTEPNDYDKILYGLGFR